MAGVVVALTGRKRARDTEREIRRVLYAVGAGVDPTRLSVEVVRRATGKATAAGSSCSARRRSNCAAAATRSSPPVSTCRACARQSADVAQTSDRDS